MTLGQQSRKTIADAKGLRRVDLKPVGSSSKPTMLKVEGKANTIICNDVLLGDVWVAAGQSNMQFGLKNSYGGNARGLCSSSTLPV